MGMFELSDRAALGGYAGAGLGSADGLDLILRGPRGNPIRTSDALRLDWRPATDRVRRGRISRAIGTEARLALRYAPEGQPFAATAGIVHDMLTGPDGAPGRGPGPK